MADPIRILLPCNEGPTVGSGSHHTALPEFLASLYPAARSDNTLLIPQDNSRANDKSPSSKMSLTSVLNGDKLLFVSLTVAQDNSLRPNIGGTFMTRTSRDTAFFSSFFTYHLFAQS